MTYDLSTDVGKVRLRIADTSADPQFTDAEIQSYLTEESGSLDLAAARCFRSRAAQYVDKMLRTGKWTEDLRGAVGSLLRQAESLEVLVATPVEEPDLQIASTAWSPFAVRDIAIDEALENSGS